MNGSFAHKRYHRLIRVNIENKKIVVFSKGTDKGCIAQRLSVKHKLVALFLRAALHYYVVKRPYVPLLQLVDKYIHSRLAECHVSCIVKLLTGEKLCKSFYLLAKLLVIVI